MTHKCAECRNGEVEYSAPDVKLVLVRDPDTKKLQKREYVCADHLDVLITDGWQVIKL